MGRATRGTYPEASFKIYIYKHLLEMVLCRSVCTSQPSQPEKVWWLKSKFLAFFPKSGMDQWDCEIGNYYIYSTSLTTGLHTFFEQVWCKVALSQNFSEAQENLTWFTRLASDWNTIHYGNLKAVSVYKSLSTRISPTKELSFKHLMCILCC